MWFGVGLVPLWAARFSEDPTVRVLLIEAGGSDNIPEVMIPNMWAMNLGSERDLGFVEQSIRQKC